MKRKLPLIMLIVFLFGSYAQNGFTLAPIKIEYQINNLDKTVYENVIAKLHVEEQTVTLNTIKDVNEFYSSIKHNVGLALRPFGYFNPLIHTQLIRITETAWRININVLLGPPIITSNVDIKIIGDGQYDNELTTVLKDLPLKIGKRFTVEDYNNTKQALLNLGANRGYFKAELKTPTVKIDIAKNRATISMEYITGPRYRFGNVTYSPNPFKSSFLNRFIPFKNNYPYNSTDINIFQDRLASSSYFQQVLVQPDITQAKNLQVPVNVLLTPRKAHQYNLGIGYGTDTGPRGTLEWDWRRVTSTGHRMKTILQVSPVQNNLQALYIIPGTDPVLDQYNLSANIFTNDFKEGDSRAYQIGASYIKSIGTWRQTISLNYQLGNFQLIGQAPQHSNFLIPGISWQRRISDHPLYPKRGSKITLSLQGSSANVFSDTSFIQGEIQGKGIYSPTDASRIIGRMDIGYTSVEDLTVLPPNLRFFAGGSQSIRGFDYQALGPGRYLAVASVEMQYRIYGRWNGAVFYDAGNAFNHFNDPMQRGAGFGIVWASPLGPLELTLAKALTQPGRPLRVQFAMGADL